MEQNGKTFSIRIFMTLFTDNTHSFAMTIDHPAREEVTLEGDLEKLAKTAKEESLDFTGKYKKRFNSKVVIDFEPLHDIIWEKDSSPKRCIPLRPNHCHEFWKVFNSAGPAPLEDQIGEKGHETRT